MRLPKQSDPATVTVDDAVNLILCVPSIARYLAECVTDREDIVDDEKTHVVMDITAVNGIRKWGMKVTLPAWVFAMHEKLESDEFPTPKAVKDFLKPQALLDPLETKVVAKVEVGATDDQRRADTADNEWHGGSTEQGLG